MGKKIRIIGVPMDLGQNRRGVDMGPSALRYSGLAGMFQSLGHEVTDGGNVPVPNPEEGTATGFDGRLKAVAAVSRAIYEAGRSAIEAGEFPVFLGGDHSMSIGSVTAAAKDGPVGVLWIDAHSDFNTPATSPSKNIHGMPVSVLVGDGPESLVNVGFDGAAVKHEQVVQIGIRNLDQQERVRLTDSGVHVYTMRHIDEEGIAAVVQKALAHFEGFERVHVSLDMDSLDPSEAPGVGTPVRGGLTFREAHLIMELVGDADIACSLDIVEVNPILDDRNRTAELGVGLAGSLLGQRIL